MKNTKFFNNFRAVICTLIIGLGGLPQLSISMGSDYANQSGPWKPGTNTGIPAAVATSPVSVPQYSMPAVKTQYVSVPYAPTWIDRVRNFGYKYIKDPATNVWYKGQYYGRKLYDAAQSYAESAYNAARTYGRAATAEIYHTAQSIYNFPYFQWAKKNPQYVLLGVAVIGTAVVGVYYLSRAYANQAKINEAKMYVELRNQFEQALSRLIDRDKNIININQIDTIVNVFNDNLRSIEFSVSTNKLPQGYITIKGYMNQFFSDISHDKFKGKIQDIDNLAMLLLQQYLDIEFAKLGIKFMKQ